LTLNKKPTNLNAAPAAKDDITTTSLLYKQFYTRIKVGAMFKNIPV